MVEYRYCNYLKDKITEKYDAAMMIYCDFGAIIPNEQKLFLEKISNILDENGIFVFDVFGKSVLENENEYRNWNISQGNDFWSKEPYLIMEEKKIFKNENTRGERYYLIDQKNEKIKEFIMWDQYYDNESITKLLEENGFKIIEINKDIVKYNEETMFIMAKKKK